MLATLAGFLALLLGMSLLLLPLLLTELSRPRDSAWGAVVLLLGLVLVTSADRLTGAPMLAVLCGGLLVGRLGGEVAQGRWRALTDEERLALRSAERWSRSLNQLAAVAAGLLQSLLAVVATVSAWLAERRQGRSHGKRWVRSEAPAAAAQGAAVSPTAQSADADGETGGPADLEAGSVEQPVQDSAAPVAALAELTGGSDAAPAASPAAISPDQASEAAASGLPSEADADKPLDQPAAAVPGDPGVRIVADFNGVDALLAAAPEPAAMAEPSPPGQAGGPPSPSQVDG